MSTPDAFGYSIFCDDIREEVGGKVSYMGVYNGSLQVVSDTPVTLPKLGMSLTLVVPGPANMQNVSFIIQQEAGGQLVEIFKAEPSLPPVTEVTAGRISKVGINIQLAPFVIQGNSVLRARAYLNGDEVKLGTLQILMLPVNLDGRPEDLIDGFQTEATDRQ